ncbi:hypothetical protein [Anaerofustis butyriciformans]|uniref:hypothetical protein n=1 Tax=Anaerofustis butyriciformans TaxID=3108533 RepID=UPI002E2F5771|nr:hypothetical protein [Anaerofustis sp. HA2171]
MKRKIKNILKFTFLTTLTLPNVVFGKTNTTQITGMVEEAGNDFVLLLIKLAWALLGFVLAIFLFRLFFASSQERETIFREGKVKIIAFVCLVGVNLIASYVKGLFSSWF